PQANARFRGDRGGRTRHVLRSRLSKRPSGFGISGIMAFFGQSSGTCGSACGGSKRRSLRNLDPFGGRARSEPSSRVDNAASGDDRFLSQKWASHALPSCRAPPFSVREHFGSNSAIRRLRDARRLCESDESRTRPKKRVLGRGQFKFRERWSSVT